MYSGSPSIERNTAVINWTSSETVEQVRNYTLSFSEHVGDSRMALVHLSDYESMLIDNTPRPVLPGEDVITLAKGLRAVASSNLQIASEQKVANIIAILQENRKESFLDKKEVEDIQLYLYSYTLYGM